MVPPPEIRIPLTTPVAPVQLDSSPYILFLNTFTETPPETRIPSTIGEPVLAAPPTTKFVTVLLKTFEAVPPAIEIPVTVGDAEKTALNVMVVNVVVDIE